MPITNPWSIFGLINKIVGGRLHSGLGRLPMALAAAVWKDQSEAASQNAAFKTME